MFDPLLSLAVSITLIIILAILFRPNSKFLRRWRRLKQDKQRVLMEDALKHLYECERNGLTCTIKSIAGSLSHSSDYVTVIMSKLESLNLVNLNAARFQLTQEGREYALRIIRFHRLWESYLAQETGMPESKWHEEADLQEHNITKEQEEILAQKLGNPLLDPHGDPIPSVSGEIPPKRGISLNDLSIGKPAIITHIEDEPQAVYDDLIKMGFHLGMQIEIRDFSKEHINLILDGKKKFITPLLAANLNVSPISEDQKIDYPTTTLDSLKIGEKGEVIAISRACHGQQRHRLMDLGIINGTIISVELKSAGGDPIAYNIRGATIALRNEQAKMIHMKLLMEN